jgi:hypothetical protein
MEVEAKMMIQRLIAPSFAFAVATFGQQAQQQPAALFAQLGLTPHQVAAIDQGKPVATVLQWGGPSEVYVFGAVHINGTPASYVKAARDIKRLARIKGYLGVGEFSATPTAADLSSLTLDPDDIKALKNCKEADCDLQLPTASIQAFREQVNWSQPDPSSQVNGLARGMVINLLNAYQRGGNAALGSYRDKETPALIAQQFQTMIGRAATLPEVLPDLRRYLLQYPEGDLPGADSFFFWEKVNFGLKTTIRVNHGVVYNTKVQNGEISVVAIKQLYASHYFHTALDVSVCVAGAGKPRGFYLLTIKGSEQEGLTGLKGSILRKVVVNKTRSSLESALGAIKRSVEQAAPPSQR